MLSFFIFYISYIYIVYLLLVQKKPICNNEEKTLQCENGNCIPLQLFCDGDDDCGDKTDENYRICKNYQCNGTFRCDGSKCILKEKICDGIYDCIDKTDEDTLCTPSINIKIDIYLSIYRYI